MYYVLYIYIYLKIFVPMNKKLTDFLIFPLSCLCHFFQHETVYAGRVLLSTVFSLIYSAKVTKYAADVHTSNMNIRIRVRVSRDPDWTVSSPIIVHVGHSQWFKSLFFWGKTQKKFEVGG